MNQLARGTIYNEQRYKQAKLISFAGLAGVFPLATITPSDIDFIVERNSRFLIGEFKVRGQPIPTGQKILMDALLRGLPGSWVFEAEHACAGDSVIEAAECSVLRCRTVTASGLLEMLYQSGEISVLALCERWTDTFHPA